MRFDNHQSFILIFKCTFIFQSLCRSSALADTNVCICLVEASGKMCRRRINCLKFKFVSRDLDLVEFCLLLPASRVVLLRFAAPSTFCCLMAWRLFFFISAAMAEALISVVAMMIGVLGFCTYDCWRREKWTTFAVRNSIRIHCELFPLRAHFATTQKTI